MIYQENYTTFISSQSGEIFCILNDGLSLFDNDLSTSSIIFDDSKTKYQGFLEKIFENNIAANWDINVNVHGEPLLCFFSGYKIDRHTFIKISIEEIDVMTFPNNLELTQVESSFIDKGKSTGVKEFEEITRLNNELIEIQRQLARKNLELEEVNEHLEKLASTDPLTGLFNRRAILNHAQTELRRGLRESKVFGLAIVDLDQFKDINDQFGHQAGDTALLALAQILEDNTREYDRAGRLGGDEFMIFFSVASKEDLEKIIKRIIDEIREISFPVDESLAVKPKASIGAVFLKKEQTPDIELDELIKRADKALYEVKKDGGDGYTLRSVE
jgi:diguanylate cyclase (GGDEF)-like protein